MAGAQHWAREAEALGNEVKLTAPPYVRPFIRHQQKDAADAETIVIAARQAEMRFAEPDTVDQQSHAAVFRAPERLVHQRAAEANALRALLGEQGCVFPIGMRDLDRMAAPADDETSGMPALIGVSARTCWRRSLSPPQNPKRWPPVSQGAPAPDHAGCGAVEGHRDRGVWTRDDAGQNRPNAPFVRRRPASEAQSCPKR